MRADDIRRLVLESAEAAVTQAVAVRAKGGPEIAADVEAYEKAVVRLADFWRNASPAFCHAWFEVTAAEAE
jgi:hypothetical protein